MTTTTDTYFTFATGRHYDCPQILECIEIARTELTITYHVVDVSRNMSFRVEVVDWQLGQKSLEDSILEEYDNCRYV